MKIPEKIDVTKDMIQADLPLRDKVNEVIEYLEMLAEVKKGLGVK